jgi:hypothetical protein
LGEVGFFDAVVSGNLLNNVNPDFSFENESRFRKVQMIQ